MEHNVPGPAALELQAPHIVEAGTPVHAVRAWVAGGTNACMWPGDGSHVTCFQHDESQRSDAIRLQVLWRCCSNRGNSVTAVIGYWHIRLRKEMQNSSLARLHSETVCQGHSFAFFQGKEIVYYSKTTWSCDTWGNFKRTRSLKITSIFFKWNSFILFLLLFRNYSRGLVRDGQCR